jgi:hypothetical protein
MHMRDRGSSLAGGFCRRGPGDSRRAGPFAFGDCLPPRALVGFGRRRPFGYGVLEPRRRGEGFLWATPAQGAPEQPLSFPSLPASVGEDTP